MTRTSSKEATTRKKTSTRRTAKTIRNLRGTPVHLRLGPEDNRYRIQLSPRGQPGDVSTVPANLIDDHTFTSGVNILFEIITQTEARNIQYGPSTATGVEPAKLVREEETVIKRVANVDTSPRNIGPTYVNAPGSNDNLHAQLAEGNAALPPNAFPPAKIERG